MPIFDLFSKRQKRLRGDVPDIFVYDVPMHLRAQISLIIRDAVGNPKEFPAPFLRQQTEEYCIIEDSYKSTVDILHREYGVYHLMVLVNKAPGSEDTYFEELMNFFLGTKNTEQALDVIELCFQYIDCYVRKHPRWTNYLALRLLPDQAIADLNERFREHGVGFQYESGEIIRVDSEMMHAEVTRPALVLLRKKKFLGANEEYLKAHEHYRHGRNKECLTECLKAFESTLKIICAEKGWKTSPDDASKKLISVCLDNGLVSPYLQSQITALRCVLESGVPTIRNKLGGHGQGQVPQKVDDEMTRYALNLTGANIIFLIENSKIK